MSNQKKTLPWHEIAHGKMSKEAQAKFERAQRVAIDTGLAVKLTVEITVKPQRKGEREYLPVQFLTTLKEPPMKSKEFDMVMDPIGQVAVRDSEAATQQETLVTGGEA